MPFDKEAYWAARNAPKPVVDKTKIQLPPTTLVCGPCMEHPETKAKAWRGPFKTWPGRKGEYYHEGCQWQGRRV